MKESPHPTVPPPNLMNAPALPRDGGISIRNWEILRDKELRRDIDELFQRVKELPPSLERTTCTIKLDEAIFWLGMDLKRLNEPSNPTADGLRL